ncbi:Glucagon-like peptide 1 receptor [Chelonia mydas]|uniref:Glucagon-like peptide 1 receptor n=1 Tax=Chelonia mydas TaxID=8469 RepID=M7AJE7_CHEMY|nr:Glucagon-like peptide 1 receptor [Chelonia mydas]
MNELKCLLQEKSKVKNSCNKVTVLHGQVYRFCTPEGTWLLKENSTLPWKNISECEASDGDAPEEQLLYVSVIYTIGYALSFSALVVATAILLGFRHLHCTRNYIHLNLFTSFILRAVSVFIKDSVVKWMYKTATPEHQWEGLISYQESLSCRLVFVLMQYCVAANYYWLLVEGMYLYTLLVLSVFSEQRIFRLYLCIGWVKVFVRTRDIKSLAKNTAAFYTSGRKPCSTYRCCKLLRFGPFLLLLQTFQTDMGIETH